MFVVRSLVFVCVLAGLAVGQTVAGGAGRAARTAQPKPQVNYVQVEAAALVKRPADFRGRRVTLTAEVISINARQRALDLYDARSRATIGVSLAELPKTQRRRLVAAPVRQVAVYGLVELQNGRPILKAEQVMPVEIALAERESKAEKNRATERAAASSMALVKAKWETAAFAIWRGFR